MSWSWGKDPLTGAINVGGSALADVGYNTFTGSWGKGNDWGATQGAWNTYMNPNQKAPTPAAPKPTPTSTGGAWKSDGNDPYNTAMAALNAQLAALKASTPPTPRFINYDITGSWNKAREMATQAVSPIYQQKMTDFINRQQQELGRKQADTVSGKSALDMALGRLLEDTNTQRTRTAEDTTTNVNDIRDTQAFNTRQDSLNYDAASRALTEGVGAGNMAQSGLGQQQIQENQQKYREGSNETIRQMDNKVEAQNTLMNRTFEDLTTKETRSTEDTNQNKSKLDLDLERFMEDQTFEKDQQQKTLDLQKASDIAQKSVGLQGQLVDQWLQTLRGQGYTAQEIANAASIYK